MQTLQVAIVDDCEQEREFFSLACAKHNKILSAKYRLAPNMFKDAEHFLEAYNADRKFDFCVIDLFMPRVSGWSLARDLIGAGYKSVLFIMSGVITKHEKLPSVLTKDLDRS